MKASLLEKLDAIVDRVDELNALLADSEVINDQEQFKNLSIEYAELEPVAACYDQYKRSLSDIDSATEMLKESDSDMRELAREELQAANETREHLSNELQGLLLPKDPDDQRNVFLEIRAGAGGDEASIFAGDLFRMYLRFAERAGWRTEVVSESIGEHGGYKEVIARVEGKDVYAQLKFESGGHRVQRVPETESQGRIHTSACTVAVMPEVAEVDAVEIDPSELRIDTFRASGAGGQHVNKTDSAIRITHIPSGTVVECQDERSQHKNRARALSLLSSKLLAVERDKQAAAQAQTRKSLVGSGDRSQRIRTYNFPQGRVTDHRIDLTLYKLPQIMEGDVAPLIDALRGEEQAELLASLGE